MMVCQRSLVKPPLVRLLLAYSGFSFLFSVIICYIVKAGSFNTSGCGRISSFSAVPSLFKSMKSRRVEYIVAVGSFVAAVVFAFASLAISDGHSVAAGNCSVIAQFLLLTASIFGIDYKLNRYGQTSNSPRDSQQQPA